MLSARLVITANKVWCTNQRVGALYNTTNTNVTAETTSTRFGELRVFGKSLGHAREETDTQYSSVFIARRFYHLQA